MQTKLMNAIEAYAQALGRVVQAEESGDSDEKIASLHETKRQARDAVQAMLVASAPQAVQAAVPKGWMLVPIEATQEMVDAWSSATELPEGVAEQADDVVNTYAARRDWKAMLAASPETKACYAATKPAAQGMDAGKLLAEKHTGMKVDYRGLLGQVQREIERSAPGHAEMLRQLQGHLQELGQRWYAGDTAVVDELLQLYCVERQARADLAAQAKQGEQANV